MKKFVVVVFLALLALTPRAFAADPDQAYTEVKLTPLVNQPAYPGRDGSDQTANVVYKLNDKVTFVTSSASAEIYLIKENGAGHEVLFQKVVVGGPHVEVHVFALNGSNENRILLADYGFSEGYPAGVVCFIVNPSTANQIGDLPVVLFDPGRCKDDDSGECAPWSGSARLVRISKMGDVVHFSFPLKARFQPRWELFMLYTKMDSAKNKGWYPEAKERPAHFTYNLRTRQFGESSGQ